MRFQTGDIVRISKKSEWYGENTAWNPKDMEGKIKAIAGHIRVEWDNGENNFYSERDLRLVRRPTMRLSGIRYTSVIEDEAIDW